MICAGLLVAAGLCRCRWLSFSRNDSGYPQPDQSALPTPQPQLMVRPSLTPNLLLLSTNTNGGSSQHYRECRRYYRTCLAWHTTSSTVGDLQQLNDAPKTIKRLTDDVQSVHTVLELLKGVEEGDWKSLGQDVAEQSKATISSSTQACNLFRADLQQWTRHSEDGKLTWKDRANVGFFKKDQAKAMSEQLQSCKLAISLNVNVITFSRNRDYNRCIFVYTTVSLVYQSRN
jgi:hypothetical protein